MNSVFVWTFGDVVGLFICGIIVFFVAVLFLVLYLLRYCLLELLLLLLVDRKSVV